MKKILSIWLIVALLIGTTIPVFATEETENGMVESTVLDSPGPDNGPESGVHNDADSGMGDSSPVVLGDGSGDEGASEPSETPVEGSEIGSEPSDGEPVTNPSEPSESGSEGSVAVGDAFYSGMPTVNVSQESVAAIADAVSTNYEFLYDYQYVITFGAGYSIVIDSNTDVSDMNIMIGLSGSQYIVGFGGTCYISSGSTWYKPSNAFFVNTTEFISDFTYVKSVKSILSLSSASRSLNSILWSNKHVYDSNTGDLIFESSLVSPPSFTVSFETGFDDLIVDDMSSSNFVAPEITRDGYRFDGWYLSEDYSLRYTDSYEIKSDLTLYAKWTVYRTVSFSVLGIEDLVFDSVQVLDGEPYTPPTFSYSGFEYLGAYTDEGCENQFVGGTVISEDTTLYLRFEPIIYDYGALASETNKRLEALLYVQMAQGVILATVLIGNYFFRRRSGTGV